MGKWDWQVFFQDTGGGQTYLQWLMSAWGWTMSVALLALVQKVEPLWQPWKDQLAKLTYFAVAIRYPGESTERTDAAEALKFTKAIRAEIRLSLGLSPKPAGKK